MGGQSLSERKTWKSSAEISQKNGTVSPVVVEERGLEGQKTREKERVKRSLR